MKGLHLLIDCRDCDGDDDLLTSAKHLREQCLAAVRAAGLTVLSDSFHQFPGGGATGCVLLAESHLTVHTWPDLRGATLDIYVCNLGRDNEARARTLATHLLTLMAPTTYQCLDAWRGDISSPFFLKDEAPFVGFPAARGAGMALPSRPM